MYQIQVKFKGLNKKITIPTNLSQHELHKMITQCFNLNEKIVGLTDRNGNFHQLNKLNQELASSKETFSLVTAKDLNQESMSFASQYYQRQSKKIEEEDPEPTEPTLDIPSYHSTKCLGIISDLDMFEELLLEQGKILIVTCFTKVKPQSDIPYEYFLYQNESKNSVIVYSGTAKVCQFYVEDWLDPNPQIAIFIQGLTGLAIPMDNASPLGKSQGFTKKSKAEEVELAQRARQQLPKDEQIKESFIDNLNRLVEEGELSQLQYYKMKAQVLENPREFLRKYQMGTNLGLRSESREITSKEERRELQSKEERRERGRSGNRNKRYQIPIIVRKYNNVVEKISTSYPLTRQQEQAINLILELQLKGLITEKEAGLFKSSILQEEIQTFKLFREYFEDSMDQIELASKLRKKKEGYGQREESRQKSEHEMRLLIKYSKQNSYELLRKLALEGNKHVLGAIAQYRSSKNVEQLVSKLEKIANFYRAKEDLQQLQSL